MFVEMVVSMLVLMPALLSQKQKQKVKRGKINAKYSVTGDDATKLLDRSKKKTKILAELVLGYDWRLNDVMLGVDLNFGTTFGKNTVKTPNEDVKVNFKDGSNTIEDTVNNKEIAQIKEMFNVSLMPRIGYMVSPQLEVYATAGVKLARYKITTPDKNTESESDDTRISKKKFKAIPVVGAGVRYMITPNFYTKLEYNFEFKRTMAKHANTITALRSVRKAQAHVVKFGVGYKF